MLVQPRIKNLKTNTTEWVDAQLNQGWVQTLMNEMNRKMNGNQWKMSDTKRSKVKMNEKWFMFRVRDWDKQCNKWPAWVSRFWRVSCLAVASAVVFSVRWMRRWMPRRECARGLHGLFDISALHAVGGAVPRETNPPNPTDSTHARCLTMYLDWWWWTLVGAAYSNVPSGCFHTANQDKSHEKLQCYCQTEQNDQCRTPFWNDKWFDSISTAMATKIQRMK